MKFSKSIFVIAFAAMSAALLQGCLIPILGFGYTGYQYEEKKGVFAPGQPLGGPAPDDKVDKSSNSNSKPAASGSSSIE